MVGIIPRLGAWPRTARSGGGSSEDVVNRLVLLVISVLAGVGLALGSSFAVTSALSSSGKSPVNQTLYNYGDR
jgi:hypothetical protein